MPSRRVESDRITASLPSSPDPFKTPSRTSPLPPLPPYPPPEHTSRDGSGKTLRISASCVCFLQLLLVPLGVKDGITVLLSALCRPRDQAISWLARCLLPCVEIYPTDFCSVVHLGMSRMLKRAVSVPNSSRSRPPCHSCWRKSEKLRATCYDANLAQQSGSRD